MINVALNLVVIELELFFHNLNNIFFYIIFFIILGSGSLGYRVVVYRRTCWQHHKQPSGGPYLNLCVTKYIKAIYGTQCKAITSFWNGMVSLGMQWVIFIHNLLPYFYSTGNCTVAPSSTEDQCISLYAVTGSGDRSRLCTSQLAK